MKNLFSNGLNNAIDVIDANNVNCVMSVTDVNSAKTVTSHHHKSIHQHDTEIKESARLHRSKFHF